MAAAPSDVRASHANRPRIRIVPSLVHEPGPGDQLLRVSARLPKLAYTRARGRYADPVGRARDSSRAAVVVVGEAARADRRPPRDRAHRRSAAAARAGGADRRQRASPRRPGGGVRAIGRAGSLTRGRAPRDRRGAPRSGRALGPGRRPGVERRHDRKARRRGARRSPRARRCPPRRRRHARRSAPGRSPGNTGLDAHGTRSFACAARRAATARTQTADFLGIYVVGDSLRGRPPREGDIIAEAFLPGHAQRTPRRILRDRAPFLDVGTPAPTSKPTCVGSRAADFAVGPAGGCSWTPGRRSTGSFFGDGASRGRSGEGRGVRRLAGGGASRRRWRERRRSRGNRPT